MTESDVLNRLPVTLTSEEAESIWGTSDVLCAWVRHHDVRIRVSDGNIELRGSGPSYWLRRIARRADTRIKPIWTCSNHAHHEHRYRWTAWLCGRLQFLWACL